MAAMQNPRTTFRLFASALALTAFVTAGCGVDSKDDSSDAPPSDQIDTGDNGSDSGDNGSDNGDGGDVGKTDDPVAEGPMTEEPGSDGPSVGGDSDDTGDDGSSGSDAGFGGDVEAAMIDTFTQMGLDEDQASCLAEYFADQGADDPANIDYTKIMDVMGECGITYEDLGSLGG